MSSISASMAPRPALRAGPDSWQARFITPDGVLDGAPVLFTTVEFDSGHGVITSARLTITALGVCEALLDGEPVADDLLTPGWTSYDWRLRVHRHDVTGRVGDGSELALKLGNGWYRGRLGPTGVSKLYGDQLAGFAELHIRYQDGHAQTIATGPEWRARAGDTLADDLYDGQTIDARRRVTGSPADSIGVRVLDYDLAKLVGFRTPPIRRLGSVSPQRIWRSPSGATLVDFGQNVVGWVRVVVQGPAGTELTLRHAEVLDHGELGSGPLRSAQATDRFILSGQRDVFEPTFTLHGFRYLQIDGWPHDDEWLRAALSAVVVGSDWPEIGTFKCSDESISRLHENVVWSMIGNFVSVPTDCPQRDQRFGGTGPAAVFAPSAAFIGDVGPFLGDWLRDLDLEQAHADGRVPYAVPDALKLVGGATGAQTGGATGARRGVPAPVTTAIWGDAAVWVPWALWQAYGDLDALSEQLPAMLAHTRTVRSLLSVDGLWDGGFKFGDWLDPDIALGQSGGAKAASAVVATACAYRTARITSAAAAALGLTAERDEFAAMATELRDAFQRHYVDADARVHSDCATVYAMAICFGLLDQRQLGLAGERLAQLVRDAGAKVPTGVAGTPFLCDALTVTGHIDLAYELLTQTECPSWLYPLSMGATTIWERWDSVLPDGQLNPSATTGFNSYALGTIADWLHRVVGGLAPLEPGYRRFLVAPRPGGGLTSAQTSLESPLGRIAVNWRLAEDGELHIHLEVPGEAEAVIQVPGLPEQSIGHGHYDFIADRQ